MSDQHITLDDLCRLKVVADKVNNSRTGFFEDKGHWMEGLVAKDLATWVQPRGTRYRLYTITEHGREVLATDHRARAQVKELGSI
ncbi:MAG: hypothetical protein BWY85_00033 [Firmicutes bacterium ADurb.Bin506]|nr:MAG: hypothetical protein BWY85_00033 [Firmicutes bacterium ADurb.Bin506]